MEWYKKKVKQPTQEEFDGWSKKTQDKLSEALYMSQLYRDMGNCYVMWLKKNGKSTSN